MKLKTIEDIMEKLQPNCKNEKDIKLFKNYLVQFTGFLSAYTTSEDGQKAILVINKFPNISLFQKLKNVFEFTLFVMDTASPSSQ